MKLQILPPARLKTRHLHACEIPGFFRGAYGVIEEVGVGHRYRRQLVGEVQRELIRFSALHATSFYFALRGEMTPCPIFARATVDRWLDEGGRTWIIAELEARSGRRVVPFPTRNGRAS